ncbi:pyridoxal phosphate-dependent aminotransferase [Agathobaculum sp.]|uniref:pyridoxal phosphate-dependent aminotransferase n=1 Tax=Agathobaculum sp. TaxID=2048138 RepID=UPI002A7FA934|nr:histidinol-phosphate transaminase [Agathobaculum sp.]MDY3619026.1 histidinol-phosphate transaminase [Agathobaculum sp.]
MELTHGGDIYSYAEAHGGALPLDLSANINPFGAPASVLRAMHEAVEHCGHYPDPLCRAARRAIGLAENVSPDWLYCGNGAADVLDRLARVLRPRCALLTAPTFSEYERTLTGAELRFHQLDREQDFAVTERILADITPEIDAVYLCNPNNPTGCVIEPALLREIAKQCAGLGIWLVVDECFLDFLPEAETHTVKPLLGECPQLVVLRAYTKMFAVPGVRFGWCMTANRELTGALYQAGQPWNVSVIAQACAEAAAGERAFARHTAAAIKTERSFIVNSLRKRGYSVVSSQTNFVLFHSTNTMLHEKLAQKGVLIRNCANYRGLESGDYRIAVRTRADSERLLAAMDVERG